MGNMIALMEYEDRNKTIDKCISVENVSPWNKGEYKTIQLNPYTTPIATYTINNTKIKVVNTNTTKSKSNDIQKMHIFTNSNVINEYKNITLILDYQDKSIEESNLPLVTIQNCEKKDNTNCNEADEIKQNQEKEQKKEKESIESNDESYFGCCSMYKSVLNSILYYPLSGIEDDEESSNKEPITFDFYKSRKDMKFAKFAEYDMRPKYR
jgi:hypothetical protein